MASEPERRRPFPSLSQMPRDPLISSWLVEFVLRQPLEDHLVNELLHALPLLNPPQPRVYKALLLRRLASDLSRSSVPIRVMDTLEIMFYYGISGPSESMCAAYCAAAVECTVTALRSGNEGEFFDAVNRIWNCRVADLERSEEGEGLVSGSLKAAWREMEEAVVDVKVREGVRRRDSKKAALEAIRIFLKEEIGMMGPPVLETLAAQAILEAESKEKLEGFAANANGEVPGGEKSSGEFENSKKKLDELPTPEVIKVKEGLKSSCLDLQKAVKDPLPDAVLVADEVLACMDGKNTSANNLDEIQTMVNANEQLVEMATNGSDGMEIDHDAGLQRSLEDQNPCDRADLEGNQKVVDEKALGTSTDKVAQANGAGNADTVAGEQKNGDRVRKHSIMDWNPTARTDQWDEETIGSSDESENQLKKPHLASLKRRAVSPLNIIGKREVVGRRRRKKWSALEEETLRKAVERYGRGKWKLIKNCHAEIFEDRTEVDLKDKWRNMIRH